MIDMHELIGQELRHRKTMERGRITEVVDNRIVVDYYTHESRYIFPAAFSETLELKNQELQKKYQDLSLFDSFDLFRNRYANAISDEISYLKANGGKRYRAMDGVRLPSPPDVYIYLFETDSELNLPDNTEIKLWLREDITIAYVVACEEFTITFRALDYLPGTMEMIEFSAEPWHLLEAIPERLRELDKVSNPIAASLACTGKGRMRAGRVIPTGQETAQKLAISQPITFIWGPPGTGKTETLANIALDFMNHGKRVLMLSYSNVSVDGAVMRVARKAENVFPSGAVIRYGYPRSQEVIDYGNLTSYQYVLQSYPALADEFNKLNQRKKAVRKNDPERISINKRIAAIRSELSNAEKNLIQDTLFVATTVSKALVDKAVYSQTFDLVIFDEASMAYVPQVVFAAGLARESFCCLGDFRQLPAIVQNPKNDVLVHDIFEYTGITEAVDRQFGHDWLVMLSVQHRMHADIAGFVSREMYEGLLSSAPEEQEQRREIAVLCPFAKKAIGFVDLSGSYSVCTRTMDGSRINILSAFVSFAAASQYIGKYGVGIITPYSAQSRLLLAMIRDMSEIDDRYRSFASATVHQFQGSEKPVIVYDAVDCYRMPYPGALLTSMKNDTADRLYNVAVTRAQGKFILVANRDYLVRKRLSKNLLFSKMMNFMQNRNCIIQGEEILNDLESNKAQKGIQLGLRENEDIWKNYLSDLKNATSTIELQVPGMLEETEDRIQYLIKALAEADEKNVRIYGTVDEETELPVELKKYLSTGKYVPHPITIIDSEIIWFGEPLSDADFISEGEILITNTHLCARFAGKHTARLIRALI